MRLYADSTVQVGDVTIYIKEVKGQRVTLGIKAPVEMHIKRIP